jgi:very-short-patch-repair endonuclease
MTSLERKVANTLSSIGFHVADDGPANTWYPQFKVGRYRIDFAFPNDQIAIEVDGNYWHKSVGTLTCRQVAQRERDLKKNRVLLSRGWKIIRVHGRLVDMPEFAELINNSILRFIEV